MSNANISISLFRVSGDGQYLDVIIDCPHGYQFSQFDLTAQYKNANGEEQEDTFNIGDGLFYELAEIAEDGEYKYVLSKRTHWVIRINIAEQLELPNIRAMYFATFKAKSIYLGHSILNDEDMEDWDHEHTGEEQAVRHIMYEKLGVDEIVAQAVCSDVSDVYNNILDGVINQTGTCDKVSDDTIRVYLILYAHQEAMRLGHYTDAWLYFKMITSNFNKCGNFARSGNGPSCGCSNSQPFVKTSSKSGGASCGCGKK